MLGENDMDASATQTGLSQAEPVSRLGPSGFDPLRIEAAISLAVSAHTGQVDKAGKPYILHPLRVMFRLNDPVAQVVAVLHDVVEDCGIPVGDLEMEFGSEVADAVDALTRRDWESYEDFIERCGENPIARSVKWADLCDNMDLSRLPTVTSKDRARYVKYLAARERLNAIAMEARQGGDGETRLHPKDDSAGAKDIAQ